MSDANQILDSLNTLICKANRQGRFTYLNPFWAECLGWTMDELFSRPFISFVHSDDIESTQAAFSRLINDKLAVVGFQNRYCKADGKYVWLGWTSRVGSESYSQIWCMEDHATLCC